MLFFWTDIALNCGITLNGAYVALEWFHVCSRADNKLARLHWRVFKDKTAYTGDLQPIARKNLPAPFASGYTETTNSTAVNSIVSNLLDGGIQTMIVNLVEGILGSENVTWDE